MERHMELFPDWCRDWLLEWFVEWPTESLFVPSLNVARYLIISLVSSVHCAVGSTVVVAWSGASDGLQAPQSDPNSIRRTGLRDDGSPVEARSQGLAGCATVLLRFPERLPGYHQSCVENGFRLKCHERCLERRSNRVTD